QLVTSVGPLSLLLLPKCPLCLIPLLAFLGIAMPPPAGLWIAAGILVLVWLALLVAGTKKQPLLLAIGGMAAAVSLVAVAIHNRPLLWTGIVAMALVGFALSRACAHRPVENVLRRTVPCDKTLTSDSREA
ncbi:MAG TPA: hypothetical protein VGS96_03110, partial [Thermoanaerobaculia bacterium]|nr:hypothetical protein [Thermoanaerobaculia bacterium]